MTTILNQPSTHLLKDFSEFSSNAFSTIKTLAPQMVCLGTIAGTIHAGLSWTNFSKFEGTPFTSALFFGLMPAVQKASGAIFKSFISNDPSRKMEQIKAQQLIATTCATLCIPVVTTLAYNILANSLNKQQWDTLPTLLPNFTQPDFCTFYPTWSTSTVLSQQYYGTLHFPALFCGMGMMANKAVKTVLKAQGLSEAEIELQMSNASNDLKSKNLPLSPPLTGSEEILSKQSSPTKAQI